MLLGVTTSPHSQYAVRLAESANSLRIAGLEFSCIDLRHGSGIALLSRSKYEVGGASEVAIGLAR